MVQVSLKLLFSSLSISTNRNGDELAEISSHLELSSLGLEHEGNYSCAALNYLGTGEQDTLQLEVIGDLQTLNIQNCGILYYSAPCLGD